MVTHRVASIARIARHTWPASPTFGTTCAADGAMCCSTALLYVFALSFLSLCGYVYLLAQLRQREQVASSGQYAPQYQPQYTGQVHGQPYSRADHR